METDQMVSEQQVEEFGLSAIKVSITAIIVGAVCCLLGVSPWAVIGSVTALGGAVKKALSAARNRKYIVLEGMTSLAVFAAIALWLSWQYWKGN